MNSPCGEILHGVERFCPTPAFDAAQVLKIWNNSTLWCSVALSIFSCDGAGTISNTIKHRFIRLSFYLFPLLIFWVRIQPAIVRGGARSGPRCHQEGL